MKTTKTFKFFKEGIKVKITFQKRSITIAISNGNTKKFDITSENSFEYTNPIGTFLTNEIMFLVGYNQTDFVYRYIYNKIVR